MYICAEATHDTLNLIRQQSQVDALIPTENTNHSITFTCTLLVL